MAIPTEEIIPDEKYGSLKTLTVLTFIGCALGYIFGIYGFINAENTVTKIEEGLNNPNLPDMAKKFVNPEALESAQLMASNKLPILVLGLIGTTLCLIGALQMRKLKVEGYFLWLIGEILPFISAIIFINAASIYKGFAVIGILIALVFIILYTVNKKYLTRK
jgi:hypothetical protein